MLYISIKRTNDELLILYNVSGYVVVEAERKFRIWESWSKCSVTCGRGLRSRIKSCSGYTNTKMCRVYTRRTVENKQCTLGPCAGKH